MKGFLFLLAISLGINAYVSKKTYIPDENHPPPRHTLRQAEEEKAVHLNGKKDLKENQKKSKSTKKNPKNFSDGESDE